MNYYEYNVDDGEPPVDGESLETVYLVSAGECQSNQNYCPRDNHKGCVEGLAARLLIVGDRTVEKGEMQLFFDVLVLQVNHPLHSRTLERDFHRVLQKLFAHGLHLLDEEGIGELEVEVGVWFEFEEDELEGGRAYLELRKAQATGRVVGRRLRVESMRYRAVFAVSYYEIQLKAIPNT